MQVKIDYYSNLIKTIQIGNSLACIQMRELLQHLLQSVMDLNGGTYNGIAAELTQMGVKTPCGNEKWIGPTVPTF